MKDQTNELDDFLCKPGDLSVEHVRLLLAQSIVFGFGRADDTLSESFGGFALVHFSLPFSPGDYVAVFTHLDHVGKALDQQPDWGHQSLLEIHGQALIDFAPSTSTIVLNPWSEFEFHLW